MTYLVRYGKEQTSKVIIVGYPSLGINFWTCVTKPVLIILLPARKHVLYTKKLLDPIIQAKANGIQQAQPY